MRNRDKQELIARFLSVIEPVCPSKDANTRFNFELKRIRVLSRIASELYRIKALEKAKRRKELIANARKARVEGIVLPGKNDAASRALDAELKSK